MTRLAPDADVLISIQRAGQLSAFMALDKRPLPWVVTDTVWDELTIGASSGSAAASVVFEMTTFLEAVVGEPTKILPQTDEARTFTRLGLAQDPGELSIIAYAIHHKDVTPVMIDRSGLHRAVEELRGRVLSLHGFLDLLRSHHGLETAVAETISTHYCQQNKPAVAPLWWQSVQG